MFITMSEMQSQFNRIKLPESALNGDMTTEMDRGATDAIKP